MLSVKNITFEYIKHTPILNDISFSVRQGIVCGLFGPNGCGKTTLFRCCLKFLPLKNGSININNHDISTQSVHDMATLVSYVPQEHKPSFPYLVWEVVLMGRTPHLDKLIRITPEQKQKTLDALRLVGIEHLAETPYNQLSGGQRQLVIIARAVAQETKVMLLDEPTSALDFSNQIRIWKLLRIIAQQGTTVIACTHDPNHVIWFCDEVLVMNNNHMLAAGNAEEIISSEILDKIYPDLCQISKIEYTKVVFPHDVEKLKNHLKKQNTCSTVSTKSGG